MDIWTNLDICIVFRMCAECYTCWTHRLHRVALKLPQTSSACLHRPTKCAPPSIIHEGIILSSILVQYCLGYTDLKIKDAWAHSGCHFSSKCPDVSKSKVWSLLLAVVLLILAQLVNSTAYLTILTDESIIEIVYPDPWNNWFCLSLSQCFSRHNICILSVQCSLFQCIWISVQRTHLFLWHWRVSPNYIKKILWWAPLSSLCKYG